MSQTPALIYSAGQQLDGFVIQRAEPLEELRSVAYELHHPVSGARILHLHNTDGENLFSVTFPTPPPDHTGVAHILEHCVLGGSQKYSVKDPFFEMIKCSMATFINAMTAADHTLYPVSTNVKRDYYNLADVYWDAVFHPTLDRRTFEREGHHLELADKSNLDSGLILKGIVYNEMKGARSSPESIVYDVIEKSLWPDTAYGLDSGGDPAHIPELTYENFKRFHESYYHPANSYIFLYGDIPTADHLQFLSPRLAQFRRRSPAAPIPTQPRWKSPRTVTEVYPVGAADPIAKKTYISFNWLTGDGLDPADVLALAVLDLVLLGNQAAPLRKALIDSHLGDDVIPAGVWVNGIESSFHVGLKGAEADRATEIENLVTQTLRKVASEGIAKDHVAAAFQQLAYRNLEIASLFPLHLMGRAVHLWMHGKDPLRGLRTAAELAALKDRYARDPGMFGALIEQRLLNNSHRLTVIVSPDREIQAKRDAEFTQHMKSLKASLSADQIKNIAVHQAELETILDAPNPPEAIAALPQLTVADLPKEPRHIPTTVQQGKSLEFLRNDVFANGVNYLNLSFDLAGLPQELLPYLPLYSHCMGKMGAAGADYTQVAQRMSAHTGGIGFSHSANMRVDRAEGLRRASFTLKFLDDKLAPAMDLFHDLIFTQDCSDEPRLSDLLAQVRAHHRTRPASDGLGIALRHAGRSFSLEGQLNELWAGVPQTQFIERVAGPGRSEVAAKLAQITAFFRRAGRPTASFTGADSIADRVRTQLDDWLSGQSPAPATTISLESASRSPQGLAAPMNVAYCATVLPAPRIFDPIAPLLAVGARLVSYNHILEEVRFKGTAYGGGCSYIPSMGVMEFYSYRDPWIWRTLDAYRQSIDFVRNSDWSQAEVDRAIIGTAKEFERPIRPGEATGNALWRHLTGDTPQRRQARHAALLRASAADVKRAILSVLESGFPQAAVCVVSSRQKLEEANAQRPSTALPITDILPAGAA